MRRLSWRIAFAYASVSLICHVVDAAWQRETNTNGTINKELYYVVDNVVVSTIASETSETPKFNEFKFTLFFIFDGIVNPIMGIVGMLSNILNVIVLTRRRMRSSMNMFLVGLAVADFFVLLVTTVFYIRFMGYYKPAIIPPNTIPENETFGWYLYYHTWYMVANIFTTASNWSIMFVTIYRFIAVCYPIKAHQICTMSRTRIFIALIYLAAFIINLPDFFTVTCTKIVVNNVTKLRMNETALYNDPTFGAVYYNINTSLNVFLPWIVCFALTIKLIMTLRKSTLDLQHISAQSQSTTDGHLNANGRNTCPQHRAEEHKRITRMLILLVIWFLICQFPGTLMYIFPIIYTRHIVETTTEFIIFRNISDVFLIANHASNFVFYATTNQLYRKEIVQFVTCKKTRLKKLVGLKSGSNVELRTQMTSILPNGS